MTLKPLNQLPDQLWIIFAACGMIMCLQSLVESNHYLLIGLPVAIFCSWQGIRVKP